MVGCLNFHCLGLFVQFLVCTNGARVLERQRRAAAHAAAGGKQRLSKTSPGGRPSDTFHTAGGGALRLGKLEVSEETAPFHLSVEPQDGRRKSFSAALKHHSDVGHSQRTLASSAPGRWDRLLAYVIGGLAALGLVGLLFCIAQPVLKPHPTTLPEGDFNGCKDREYHGKEEGQEDKEEDKQEEDEVEELEELEEEEEEEEEEDDELGTSSLGFMPPSVLSMGGRSRRTGSLFKGAGSELRNKMLAKHLTSSSSAIAPPGPDVQNGSAGKATRANLLPLPARDPHGIGRWGRQ